MEDSQRSIIAESRPRQPRAVAYCVSTAILCLRGLVAGQSSRRLWMTYTYAFLYTCSEAVQRFRGANSGVAEVVTQ
jgi:hypothetical protein